MSEEQLSEIVAGLDWDLGFADGEKESKQTAFALAGR